MSLLKTYKLIKNIIDNKNKDIQIVTQANISVVDNEIILDINGIPSNILISYSGAGVFDSKLPLKVKSKIGKNTILISNLFKEEIPKVLFEYGGNIKISSCSIANFDSTLIQANIDDVSLREKIERSTTSVDDDTLIIYEEQKVKVQRPLKTGLISKQLSSKVSPTIKKERLKPNLEAKIAKTETMKPLKSKPKIERQTRRPIKETQQTIKYEGGK